MDITISLTTDEVSIIEESVGAGNAEQWIRDNVAALVKQCRDAARVRLVGAAAAQLPDDEYEAIVSMREVKVAAAVAAAAAKLAEETPAASPPA